MEAVEKREPDWRIRQEQGRYRVVAPGGRKSGGGILGSFYVNGHLVIERKEKDALGGERWVHVGSLRWDKGMVVIEPREDAALDRALFVLLAGGNVSDKELGE